MARVKNNRVTKTVSLPIERTVVDKFRDRCKELKIPMSLALEIYMNAFAKDKFAISFAKDMNDGEFKFLIREVK